MFMVRIEDEDEMRLDCSCINEYMVNSRGFDVGLIFGF